MARRHEILNVGVDPLTLSQVVERCQQAIAGRTPFVIGCVNAAKMVQMQTDGALRDAVTTSDVVVADGMAVVWAGRLLGTPLPERVTGIDLFNRLLEEGHKRRQSVYLLGARQEVVQEVVQRCAADYPGLRIAGYRNGYFSEDDLPEILEEIRRSEADMLFLGITPPKKEFFLARHGRTINVSVAHGVGGSFDVMAGRVKRAPRLVQRLGLEWLFRVVQEPRRMWLRYLVTNTKFIYMLIRELLRRPARSRPS